ncbi:MAG: hypothetical protein AABY22_26830 [Nanoarchaeota archaeon]
MAKIQILGINGNKEKEISTEIFAGEIRPDIVQKIAEIERNPDDYFADKISSCEHIWNREKVCKICGVVK